MEKATQLRQFRGALISMGVKHDFLGGEAIYQAVALCDRSGHCVNFEFANGEFQSFYVEEEPEPGSDWAMDLTEEQAAF